MDYEPYEPYDPKDYNYTDRESQIFKRAVKSALKEWLDEKFAVFGRWSFWSLVALASAVSVYAILTLYGWKPPI